MLAVTALQLYRVLAGLRPLSPGLYSHVRCPVSCRHLSNKSKQFKDFVDMTTHVHMTVQDSQEHRKSVLAARTSRSLAQYLCERSGSEEHWL